MSALQSPSSSLWHPDVETKRQEIRKKIDEPEQVDVVLGRLRNCRCGSIEQCVRKANKDSVWKIGDDD